MKKKKVLALLVAATMTLGLLAGCGDSSGDNTGNDSSAANGSSADSTGTGEGGAADAGTGEGASAGGELTLPLTEENVTLKIWLPAMTNILQVYSTYDQVPFFQEMERRTGVHMEFETPVVGEETTAFNLMISSGELPDIICYPNTYSEGLDAAIDDGYYLDLTPYLDTYLSNYNALRKTNKEWMMNSVTDSGRAAAIYLLYTEPQGPWGGLQIRQDWLDDLGLDTPTTYEELEEVLTAFKEQKGAYAPLALCSHGNYFYGEMSAGFGVTDSFMNVDGTVVAGFITDGWKEYLTLMNDWYKKGLIDPDFMTDSAWMVDTELVTTGASGVWWSMYSMPPAYEATDENMVVSPLASPKMNKDDILHFRLADSNDGIGVAISADCENVEIALKWIDYLFTEEGSLFANYGIEGESFYYDDKGEIQLTDKVLNKDDQVGLLSYALLPDKIPSYYDWTRELKLIPEKDLASYDVWGADDHLDDWVMPESMTMTSSESVEMASMYTDIETYYREASCQFITGVLDISGSDWDNYVDTIKGMGIDRCTEIQQAALDRYLAR